VQQSPDGSELRRGHSESARVDQVLIASAVRRLMNWLKYSIRSAGAIPGSTSADQHRESDAARDYELVLDPRFRTASNWPATLAALCRIREYRPHVVIAEQVRDPRWIALAGLAPRIQLVHDGGLHDAPERRPTCERAATIAPSGSTVWETISCQNGCE
jgi:hypothetical protein